MRAPLNRPLGWTIAVCLVTCATLVPIGAAAPLNPPIFSATYQDARTDDNEFIGTDSKQRWDIDLGADSYQNEYYERPTIQGFTTDGGPGTYSAEQYHANLDIVFARAGRDEQFLYVEINLVGDYFEKDNVQTTEGLKYEYGFRFSDDPDGRDGYLMYGEFANPMSQVAWTALKTKASRDTDSDVGGRGGPIHGNGGPTGLSVTQEDNNLEDNGLLNGYDLDIVNDGKIQEPGHPELGEEVLFIRMVGTNTVQFAFDYVKYGLSASYIDGIQYLDMQSIKGGPKDPRNYMWNDKYDFNEAGSPYLADFNNGIQPPSNVYELDTIRGGVIPEPGAIGLLGLLACLGMVRPRTGII